MTSKLEKAIMQSIEELGNGCTSTDSRHCVDRILKRRYWWTKTSIVTFYDAISSLEKKGLIYTHKSPGGERRDYKPEVRLNAREKGDLL